MIEGRADSALAAWSAAECPFAIEYSQRVLDDIRLAVVDAFFSLPRGGAEIGGILLGKYARKQLVISGYQPLDCEHATGPSFTLSEGDRTRLADLLNAARENPGGMAPVGWYHSHTRSEIFLSEADLEIHHRFFPKPWQVALVLKPHTFLPTRLGIFFREAGGAIHASAPYEEIKLEPLPPKPVAETRGDLTQNGPSSSNSDSISPEAPPDFAQIPSAAMEPADGDAATSRRWPWILVAIAIGMALGAAGFQTRSLWMPKVMATLQPMLPAPAPPSLGLTAVDTDGQLVIRWDRNAKPVAAGIGAFLEITDGGPLPQSLRLDAAHLQAGSFIYSRQSERVDVTLVVDQQDGSQVREMASFLGKLPSKLSEDPTVKDLKRQIDEMQRELHRRRAKRT